MPSKSKADTINEKLQQLEKISQYFNSPELDLDEGLQKYEEGMKLTAEVKGLLESYEQKINEIRTKYASPD